MPATPRSARLTVCAVVLVAVAASVSPAAAAPGHLVVGAGPYEAMRAEDGSTTLELTVSNVSTEVLTLSLDGATGCENPAEKPTVPASFQADATFTMQCSAGDEKRTADLTATPPDGDPMTVEVPFTLAAPTGPSGSHLAMFLVAIVLGLLATVLPYWMWKKNPQGNPDPSGTSPPPTATAPDKGKASLGWTLPGITKDWSFVDNWASNVGLATALFTGVFAATDPLEVLLDTESSQAQSTIVVASALAAALIGAAPLLLVIFKRRYRSEGGVARDNTVGGVLAASFVVMTAGTGLVLSAAAVLGGFWPWTAAVVAGAVLVVYAWKSIPQTLALGRYEDLLEPAEPRVNWAINLTTAGDGINGSVTRGAPTVPTPADDAVASPMSARPSRRDFQVSAMP